MANPLHHAISSSRKWGGDPELYLPIHEWFDEPKGWIPDFRQRAIRHHSEGIAEAVKLFEPVRVACDGFSGGRPVPVRWIAEQHVLEDLGAIPTAADWLRELPMRSWMQRSRRLSQELAPVPLTAAAKRERMAANEGASIYE